MKETNNQETTIIKFPNMTDIVAEGYPIIADQATLALVRCMMDTVDKNLWNDMVAGRNIYTILPQHTMDVAFFPVTRVEYDAKNDDIVMGMNLDGRCGAFEATGILFPHFGLLGLDGAVQVWKEHGLDELKKYGCSISNIEELEDGHYRITLDDAEDEDHKSRITFASKQEN